MNIVLITDPSITNNYLRKKFSDQFMTYIVEENASALTNLSRVVKRKNKSFFEKIDVILFFVFYKIFKDSKTNKLLKKHLENKIIEPNFKTNDINSPTVISKVNKFEPDYIFTLGCSKLNDQWLDTNYQIINIHTGILPNYRGRFCWFWPIYNKEPEFLGITAHIVTSKLDAGSIVGMRPTPVPNQETKIENLLLSTAQSSGQLIDSLIDNLKNNKPLDKINISNKSFPIYFEPGISDYFRFIFKIP